MKYTLQDNQDHRLLEMEFTVHLPAWRHLLLGHGGILTRLANFGWYVLWLWLCSGWQIAWPNSFPSLGLYPLALFVAFWSSRRSLVGGIFACILGGWLVDAGTFLALGSHALALIPVALLATYLEDWLPSWKFTVLAPIAQGLCASLLFGVCFLLFCGGDSDVLFRLQQLGKHVLPSALVAGLLVAPLLFALWELVPFFGRQRQ